jgi:oligosaccharide repeat unit polymerase
MLLPFPTRGIVVLGFLVIGYVTAILLEIRNFGLLSGTNSFTIDLRSLAQFRLSGVTSQYSLPWYLQVFRNGYFYFIPLATLLLRRGALRRRWYLLVCGIALMGSFDLFTRAPVLVVAMTILVSWAVVYRPSPRHIVAGLGLLAVMGFTFFLLVERTRVESVHSAYTYQVGMYVYSFGSMKGYDALIHGDYPREQGFYGTNAINYLLSKLGYPRSYPPETRAYIFVPYPVNTYTFLDAFTLDAGTPGMLVGAALLGAFTSATYRWVWSGRSFAALPVYAYVMSAMILSLWNAEILRFTFWLVFVLSLALDLLLRHTVRGHLEASDPPERSR